MNFTKLIQRINLVNLALQDTCHGSLFCFSSILYSNTKGCQNKVETQDKMKSTFLVNFQGHSIFNDINGTTDKIYQ